MKKNLLILALIFALVIVSGCNKNEVDKHEINLGNNEKQEIADTLLENNQKETKDDNAEYVINYEDALAKVYAFINNIDDEVGPIDGFEAGNRYIRARDALSASFLFRKQHLCLYSFS